MHKVIHYREKCIGCGICFELQPETWRMSRRDGKAVLIGATVKRNVHVGVCHDPLVVLKYVVESCPVKVIHLGN